MVNAPNCKFVDVCSNQSKTFHFSSIIFSFLFLFFFNLLFSEIMMFLPPKTQKFKNVFINKRLWKKKNLEFKFNFGSQGLISKNIVKIKSNHLESVKKLVKFNLRKKGKINFPFFTHFVVTKKPKQHRMGKGKGRQDYWFSALKSGKFFCEISGFETSLIKKSLIYSKSKLPPKLKYLSKSTIK